MCGVKIQCHLHKISVSHRQKNLCTVQFGKQSGHASKGSSHAPIHACTVYTYLSTYKTLARHKGYSEYHLMSWRDRMNPTIYYLMAILNFLPPSNGMLCSSVLKQLKFVLNKPTLFAPPQPIQLVWHIYIHYLLYRPMDPYHVEQLETLSQLLFYIIYHILYV